jgi:hypothetical protein
MRVQVRNARLAVEHWVVRSSDGVHHAGRSREPHEGMFRFSERNQAFSGFDRWSAPRFSEVGFG